MNYKCESVDLDQACSVCVNRRYYPHRSLQDEALRMLMQLLPLMVDATERGMTVTLTVGIGFRSNKGKGWVE